MRRGKKEEDIQISLSKYVSYAFPDVIFTFDASGLRLPMGLAMKAAKMRSERGIPDFHMLEPRGRYHGLQIELKKDGEKVFLKDGSISQSKSSLHLREQHAMIRRLQKKGFACMFCIGLESAIHTVNNYMSLPARSTQ